MTSQDDPQRPAPDRAGERQLDHTLSNLPTGGPPSPGQAGYVVKGSPLQVGTVLAGRYRILSELGRGGFGVVYLADDERLRRQVAIKTLLPASARDERALEAILQEARTVASLSHPNIVTLHEVGEVGGLRYAVTEFLAGGSLHDRVRHSGPLDERALVSMTRELGRGLAYAHFRGVIHRDIKPSNVLFTADGIPKLSDFGLARDPEEDLSVEGWGAGTPLFAAPEQLRCAGAATPASDIFSLAATLYFAATGDSPHAVRFDRVPQALRAALERAMETDPAARPSRVEGFVDLLGIPAPLPPSAPTTPLSGVPERELCNRCGATVTSRHRHCPSCGQQIVRSCRECAAPMPLAATFCGQCGASRKPLDDAEEPGSLAPLLDQARRALEDGELDRVEGLLQQVPGADRDDPRVRELESRLAEAWVLLATPAEMALTRPCPSCAEEIPVEAARCAFCHEWVEVGERPPATAPALPSAAPQALPAPAPAGRTSPPAVWPLRAERRVRQAEQTAVLTLVGSILALCMCCPGLILAPFCIYHAGKAERVLREHGSTQKAQLARAARIIGWLVLAIYGIATLVNL